MTFISRRVTVIALSAWCMAACRSPTPTAPANPLTGAWIGTIVDSQSGPGRLTLNMTQVQSSAAGDWSATFQNGSDVRSGSMSGTITHAAVSLYLTPSTPTVCTPAATLSGTLAIAAALSGTRLQGTYVVLACTGTTTGSIDLSRSE